MRPLPLLLAIWIAAEAGAQNAPAALEDLRVATAVRLALATDPVTAAADPRIAAYGGAVVVEADWPSSDAEARAAAVAAGVAGVTSVAMGDAPPRPAETLGAGAAVEPDERPATDEAGERPEQLVEPAAPPVPPRPAALAPPPPEPAPAPAVTHTVRAGDTLYSIARRYGTTVADLQRLNGLGASTEITLGRRLRVSD